MAYAYDDDDYLAVVAIDFGTTFSGYALSMRGKPDSIMMNKNWGSYKSFSSLKTPTSVLFNDQEEVLAFGFEAEDMYYNEVEDAGQAAVEDLHLFQHFKMTMHKKESVSRSTTVKSKDGLEMNAFDLITRVLRYLKEHVLDRLSSEKSKVGETDIRWVITVPAIWTDDSKRFMREAAYKAGMTTSLRSRKLLIALEPEAAAVYCRSLDSSNFAFEATKKDLRMPVGTKYLVVDCGGGTVDIAVHQVTGPDAMSEIFPPTGGEWGGITVNDRFQNTLASIFGEDVVKYFKKHNHRQWWALINEFEAKKRGFDGNRSGKGFRVQLPHQLAVSYRKLKSKKVEEVFLQPHNRESGIEFKAGFIIFGADITGLMFEDSIRSIVSHLQAMAADDRLRDVSHMMLVGGFSESPYLQKSVIDAFHSDLHVLIPFDAGLAVLKGAVMYGLQPHCIQNRVIARTYGTNTHTDFIPGVHKESKKVKTGSKVQCKDIFLVFVKKGTIVNEGITKSYTFKPFNAKQTRISFTLYSSINEDVTYIDEEGVIPVDKITVHLPDTKDGLNRRVRVDVTFGGTEVTIRAYNTTNDSTGQSKKLELLVE